MDDITPESIIEEVRHWLRTPAFAYLGSSRGSSVADLLQEPLSGPAADRLLAKMMRDIPILSLLGEDVVRVSMQRNGMETLDIFIEIFGQRVPLVPVERVQSQAAGISDGGGGGGGSEPDPYLSVLSFEDGLSNGVLTAGPSPTEEFAYQIFSVYPEQPESGVGQLTPTHGDSFLAARGVRIVPGAGDLITKVTVDLGFMGQNSVVGTLVHTKGSISISYPGPGVIWQWTRDQVWLDPETSGGGVLLYIELQPTSYMPCFLDNIRAVLRDPMAPSFSLQPQATTVNVGGSFWFAGTVGGDGTIALQWLKDGQAISGATSDTYSKSNAAASDAGVYTLRATSEYGTVTSDPAALTVNVVAPSIYAQPTGTATVVGGVFSITANVHGTAPISLQWFKVNAGAISGATSATYASSAATLDDAGDYYLVATNSAGSVTSNTVHVEVTTPVVGPSSITLDFSEWGPVSSGSVGMYVNQGPLQVAGLSIPSESSVAYVLTPGGVGVSASPDGGCFAAFLNATLTPLGGKAITNLVAHIKGSGTNTMSWTVVGTLGARTFTQPGSASWYTDIDLMPDDIGNLVSITFASSGTFMCIDLLRVTSTS